MPPTRRCFRSARTGCSSGLLLAARVCRRAVPCQRIPAAGDPDPVPDPGDRRRSASTCWSAIAARSRLGSAAFMAVGAYARTTSRCIFRGSTCLSCSCSAGCAPPPPAWCSGCRRCASRAITSRSRRWRRSSSSTGCSSASRGSPVTRRRARCRRRRSRIFGLHVRQPGRQLPVLPRRCCVLIALAAKNIVRGRIGRMWMAIRDMDIAAEIIGISPLRAKLSAFAISSFVVGVAGGVVGVRASRLVGAARLLDRPLVRAAVHDRDRRARLDPGRISRRRLHHDVADLPQPAADRARHPAVDRDDLAPRTDDLRRADRVFPDRRAARLARLWAIARRSCGCGRSRIDRRAC